MELHKNTGLLREFPISSRFLAMIWGPGSLHVSCKKNESFNYVGQALVNLSVPADIFHYVFQRESLFRVTLKIT